MAKGTDIQDTHKGSLLAICRQELNKKKDNAKLLNCKLDIEDEAKDYIIVTIISYSEKFIFIAF